VRLAYRDPEHVCERLTLFGCQQLGDPSLEWAKRIREEQPDAPRALIAEDLRKETARVARVDGAVAGTPFLIALVPGYLSYLWQEGVMERRIAALYGHDPRDLETGARVLALRGVHPTVDTARKALLEVRDASLPEKPTARRPLRVWVRSLYLLLVFGGFIGARTDEGEKYAHWRLRAVLGFLIGLAIWVTTWVLPVSFMIAMAWGCESHARKLGTRTLSPPAPRRRSPLLTGTTIAAGPAVRWCGVSSSFSPSRSRSGSSPMPTMYARAPASIGSALSALS
jgi:hypothetical protein